MIKKPSVKKMVVLLIVIAIGIVFYKGSLYVPIFQDGEFFIGEWVFRDTHKDGIIGNPDFVSSFIEVDENTFIEHFERVAGDLGYQLEMEKVDPRDDRYFKTAFLIEDIAYLDYEEGFFIMDADYYKSDNKIFEDIFRSLVLTLDPEATIATLDNFLSQDTPIEFTDYSTLFLSSKVDFRFYVEDGHYKIQVEDMRMGH